MNNDNTDYVSNESGTLSRLFKLPQHGTTVRTELIAGMTTFLTMVYIVFVNPQILGAAQMDPKVVFVTTCLIAGIGSIAMGIFANLPVALAPAMGLNAFFAFVVVGAMGISWQTGMGAIFWGAVGLFLLTLFRIAKTCHPLQGEGGGFPVKTKNGHRKAGCGERFTTPGKMSD